MTIENERLQSLIEFTKQSAILRLNPVADIAKHNIFYEYEHSLQGLPGLHFNAGGEEDEVWLVVDRLHETYPPAPKDILLELWINLPSTPTKEPTLKDAIELQRLVEVGLIVLDTDNGQSENTKLMLLLEFDKKLEVEALLQTYIFTYWSVWANEEKKRRRTINLYAKLFTLKQQLEGGITDTQIEFVWGSGIALWNTSNTHICYPLVTRLIEISQNEKNMALEIRPRSMDSLLELDIYSASDNLGVAKLEKAYKDFSSQATQMFSPFDRSSYEPLLQSSVAYLDSKGIYYPTQTTADDRQLPKAAENLQVTDTWVIFARPRSKSLFIQDLEKFKQHLDDNATNEFLSNAVKALVSEPASEHEEIILPSFRGISLIQGHDTSSDAMDLFFPAPFNDEQVRIIQMLEKSDGVVVQGPPGTGKTHTIANIISHYLAMGKRVLVTSMKDAALSVLREKLPDEIRPLAISLLSSEQEGMKQFEYAITKIASEVQRIDRYALSRDIEQMEQHIDQLHAKLAGIDRKVGEWARKNMESIALDGELIYPDAAAKEVIQGTGHYEWLEDELTIDNCHQPKFDNADIIRLREARRALGADLSYLHTKIPYVTSCVDAHELLRVHQDLSQYTLLQAQIEEGDVPKLANSKLDTIKLANELVLLIRTLIDTREHIDKFGKNWSKEVRQHLKKQQIDVSEISIAESKTAPNPLLGIFEALGNELEEAIRERNEFLASPVTVPLNTELDDELIQAILNKAEGKSPFGLTGIIGKGTAKKKLQEIRIITNTPQTIEDWQFVYKFVILQRRLRELVIRWNSIAPEISIEIFQNIEPHTALQAAEGFAIYRKIKESIQLESNVVSKAQDIFPAWPHHRELAEGYERIHELQQFLDHHLMRYRLSETWAVKEELQTLLSECDGQISHNLKHFVNTILGNPAIEDIDMQSKWSLLMEELRRIHGLQGYIADVKDICSRITESGGVQWATKLCTEPVHTTIDPFLPDNWSIAWRLRRLATQMEATDGRVELKKLTHQRIETETNLAKLYQDVVVNRTWLKLAENATPNVRAALESFRIAIGKIGKGTGKRAIRYRQDARNAAAIANNAIPCWIMSHYRVSESLPPQFACFDLVIIDEASQSDFTALPAILRAKKILIVGDDKQVSPDGVGLEEEKIRNLMSRFLGTQVEIYRPQMTPERSIYDLFKVVFSRSAVMLKEHFRCVSPIIEYSKREFYNHELKPIRIPRSSERLDPPLVDVFIEDGYRKGDVNLAEARFIVNEIKAICADPKMKDRTIGVVSLLADKQALKIWEILEVELGVEAISQYKIACGDARTFQGKERDIMFISMVVSPQDCRAQGKDAIAQRYNVAASRARDRMYLVRSVQLQDLSPIDSLRRNLLSHFKNPFAQDESKVKNLRELCESDFEREVYDALTERGYKITPQVQVGRYRIDLVAEGYNDTRLAIECDGDKYHGADRWADDMNRQRILERVGWVFWRCFASTFVMRRNEVIADLLETLKSRGIEPIGCESSALSIHSEYRSIAIFTNDGLVKEKYFIEEEKELSEIA